MKIDLTVPNELKDIKLKDYQKYMKVVELSEEDTELLNIKAVEIFCHVKFKDVSGIKLTDFEDIILMIDGALKQSNKWTQKFKLKGKHFGFIPKLDDMSIGEYIDLSNYMSNTQTFHKAMAVMYRPITQEANDMYLIEEYEGADKYADIMKESTLDIMLGANVFFYNLGNELLKHTVESLEGQENQSTQVKQILGENGAGIKAFTQSLEGIYLPLDVSLN